MGIFDRFRKNKSDKKEQNGQDQGNQNPNGEPSPHFGELFRFREYIVLFMNMQMQGNYSPIAAFENPDGELTGFLYIVNDPGVDLSVQASIDKMEAEFTKRMAEGSVVAWAIFYHSGFDGNNQNHQPAMEEENLKAISVKIKCGDSAARCFGLPYQLEDDGLSFRDFTELQNHENRQIFATQLEQGKDYFQERVEIEPEIVKNEHGIDMQYMNRGAMENTWCGIFGFEYFREGGGGDFLMEKFAMVVTRPEKRNANGVGIYEVEFGAVTYRALKENEQPVTMCPVVGPGQVMPVTIKKVQEWAHIGGHEAVVVGGGRGTFGLWFFATDYAENKQLYQSQKNLEIELSGIAYVLDTYDPNARTTKSEVSFSEDFTSYMPNFDNLYLGCFDFIGIVLDMREVGYSIRTEDVGLMLTVKLITNPEEPEFFNLPMFVNRRNMRFQDIEVGMKITGMFQLQGQIAK